MTQLAVETLTVIILALTLYHLPRFSRLSSTASRARDALVALTVGGLVSVLVLTVLTVPMRSRLTPFLLKTASPWQKGVTL